VRRHADTHAAAEHRHHAVAGGPLEENSFAGRVAAQEDTREEDIALFGVELAKQKALAEQPAGIFYGRATCHYRHCNFSAGRHAL
jgi:hypothetical protein